MMTQAQHQKMSKLLGLPVGRQALAPPAGA
jgi:hypothetical protein